MRKRARLATTAGVTVLGFTAMSGIAQADTSGLSLSGLTAPLAKTGPLGKTVDGVVKQTTGSSRTQSSKGSGGSGLRLDLPIHLRLGAPQRSAPAKHSPPSVKVGAHVGLKASTDPLSVKAQVGVHLCAHPPQECGRVPSPPSPIPPAPPTPPPTPPVGNPPPTAPPGAGTGAGGTSHSASSLTVAGDSLPYTGGPIGALALLGAAAVLTGAVGVAGSRLKAGRGA